LCVCVAWKRVNPSRIMRFLRIFRKTAVLCEKKFRRKACFWQYSEKSDKGGTVTQDYSAATGVSYILKTFDYRGVEYLG
jgi:hypothetical protein